MHSCRKSTFLFVYLLLELSSKCLTWQLLSRLHRNELSIGIYDIKNLKYCLCHTELTCEKLVFTCV